MEKHNNYKQNGGNPDLRELPIMDSEKFDEAKYTRYGEDLQTERINSLLALQKTQKISDKKTIKMTDVNFGLFNKDTNKLYSDLSAYLNKDIYAKCQNGEIRHLGKLEIKIIPGEIHLDQDENNFSAISINKGKVTQANPIEPVHYFLDLTYLIRKEPEQPEEPYEVNPYHIKYFLIETKGSEGTEGSKGFFSNLLKIYKAGNAKKYRKSKRVKKPSRRRRSSKRR